jgi:hypothetical protein
VPFSLGGEERDRLDPPFPSHSVVVLDAIVIPKSERFGTDPTSHFISFHLMELHSGIGEFLALSHEKRVNYIVKVINLPEVRLRLTSKLSPLASLTSFGTTAWVGPSVRSTTTG